MIICIETATNLCSVALCDSAGVLSLKESNDLKSHASMLTLFIGDILKETGVSSSDLKAVAVSKGPGSYTGLRIGVSVAKGIAYAASIPLIGIETTLSMYTGIYDKMKIAGTIEPDTLFCPMLDARRMEVYYALYNSSGTRIKDISAEIITEDSFTSVPESNKIIFFGDGALKCKKILKRPGIHFVDDFVMSAAHMHIPVLQSFNLKRFEDVAYFEPFYLKDFITTIQRKNILG
jgi:tRNA threonylcarbamoyladenosine biosynthesis protein TsaB